MSPLEYYENRNIKVSELRCVLVFTFAMTISAIAKSQSTVFTEGKKLVYVVEYIDDNIHVRDTITLAPTGRPWDIDPKKQKELIIRYNLDRLDTAQFSDLPSIGWVQADTTGYVEDENACWFHPPRHNQYKILELAPFPRVEYPLEVGRAYTRILFIGDGWGELSHTKVTWSYKIINETDGHFRISSEARPEVSPSEINTLDFNFHPQEGFDSLSYSFSNGTLITMVRVID